jgi:hypothetical protein
MTSTAFLGGDLYLPFSRLEDLTEARRMKEINMQLRKMKISEGYCCGYTN